MVVPQALLAVQFDPVDTHPGAGESVADRSKEERGHSAKGAKMETAGTRRPQRFPKRMLARVHPPVKRNLHHSREPRRGTLYNGTTLGLRSGP
jgi:hypothetical protein